MFLTCNGFPDKIKNNLLEYNAFGILRKIPGIVNDKNGKINKYIGKLIKMQ